MKMRSSRRRRLHDFITKLSIICILLFVLLFTSNTALSCKISEFSCRANSICIPLDKYCDGKDNCGDGSDEPKFCTVCNRTYYGDVGRTYSLRVPPPQWNRLPFLCHITFTASGQDQGDIVQILFDGFSVGRFDEGLIDSDLDSRDTSSLRSMSQLPGCPEGFMQLSELGRPFTGGSWCGAATGPQLYYSETSTVTASVKVFHAPMQAATPFEFRIRYKFISQSDAIVRYGPPNELLELGRVTPGTYCTRQFDECYRKKCRLQSPNYPGMYPRNVTCYWTIRQKTVPTCKHAMIGVRQENSHKSLVKRSVASLNKTSRLVRAWSDCTGERDHLIFYDGSSTNDPVLAKYCGGDWLPRVVSRGPEMLVAFHSSPFSAPLQSDVPNRGFELDVDVLFVDSDSYDFAKGNKAECEFHINSSNPDDVLFTRRGRMGKILSPRHTLPPNTTCTYYFYGFPRDIIWISFTRYNLQILQHAIHDNNTMGRMADLPPWIARLRIWDSITDTFKSSSTSTSTTGGSIRSTTGTIFNDSSTIKYNNNNNNNNNNYYYSPQNPMYGKNIKVNVDNAWNPVDTYVYGPTPNTIFNKQSDTNQKLINLLSSSSSSSNNKYNKNLQNFKEQFNFITNPKDDNKYTARNRGGGSSGGGGGGGSGGISSIIPTTATTQYTTNQNMYDVSSSGGGGGGGGSIQKSSSKAFANRKLITELYDNETPMLCDLGLLEDAGRKMRACTPLESYVSSGNNMKIEFHTHTGTALYPASFSMNYEFVDTDLGGETYNTKRRSIVGRSDGSSSASASDDDDGVVVVVEDDIDMDAIESSYRMSASTTSSFPLCSRVFRKRSGNFQSPRNVFLHGRGGAKNLSCLYRFEATVGDRIRITLHNVSFGESASCSTESEFHTGRPKCSYGESVFGSNSGGGGGGGFTINEPQPPDTGQRIGELKIFDVPFKDVKYQIACFCDNTSSLYNVPLTIQSTSNAMELIFIVTKLNISEDFADVYFYASYEFITKIPDCRKQLRLKGSGGEQELSYPIRPHSIGCDDRAWYIESQQYDRSLFILTWGVFLPAEPTPDEMYRCNTKNRLIIYSGRPLKIMRIICPTHQGPRRSALHIFSEDWINTGQPSHLFTTKPVSILIEPILREPGSLLFQWLEIQRTKSSIIQQLDKHTNYTFNETLGDFGFITKDPECEYKCPELNACIASNLWCDGRPNCPSGYDESEEECGTTRKLLELPGSLYAVLGCIAAVFTVCIIFCICGLVRKRKKALAIKSAINGSGGGGGGGGGGRGSINNGTLRKNNYKKDSLFIDSSS